MAASFASIAGGVRNALGLHPGSLKRAIFKLSFLLAAFFVLLLVVHVALSPEPVSGAAITGWLGATFAFLFAVQKQSLDELRLFQELFAKFNERYCTLNEKLNSIRDNPIDVAAHSPSDEAKGDRDVLYDYFNLCGEEYLYYTKGYIFPEVWEAWKAGMRAFYAKPHIMALWNKELDEKSYYGLTAAEILRDRR